MKGFCLYHQNDFNRFSDKQKQELIKHHGQALKIDSIGPSKNYSTMVDRLNAHENIIVYT